MVQDSVILTMADQ